MRISVVSGLDCITQLKNPAVVVAHPGHELKIFGWLCEFRPRAYILTDGSGAGAPRLQASAQLLRQAGVVSGEVFGSVSDAEIYQAILQKRIPFFLRITEQLASSFISHGTDLVAGDATEGFNPTHDICRALSNAAIAIAERALGRKIANYEFCLTEWEQHCREMHDHLCVHLRLDDALLEKKLRAAANYSALRAEIQQAIAIKGEEYFRVECLRSVAEPLAATSTEREAKPYYETSGEERVARGKYAAVIRYRQHMLPILAALRDYVLKGATSTSKTTGGPGVSSPLMAVAGPL